MTTTVAGREYVLRRWSDSVGTGPGMRAELVRKAHGRIAERYSHEALARQLYQIYSEVTHG